MSLTYNWLWWHIRPVWKPCNPPWSETTAEGYVQSVFSCFIEKLPKRFWGLSPVDLSGWTESDCPQKPICSSGIFCPSRLRAVWTPSLTELQKNVNGLIGSLTGSNIAFSCGLFMLSIWVLNKSVNGCMSLYVKTCLGWPGLSPKSSLDRLHPPQYPLREKAVEDQNEKCVYCKVNERDSHY